PLPAGAPVAGPAVVRQAAPSAPSAATPTAPRSKPRRLSRRTASLASRRASPEPSSIAKLLPTDGVPTTQSAYSPLPPWGRGGTRRDAAVFRVPLQRPGGG